MHFCSVNEVIIILLGEQNINNNEPVEQKSVGFTIEQLDEVDFFIVGISLVKTRLNPWENRIFGVFNTDKLVQNS